MTNSKNIIATYYLKPSKDISLKEASKKLADEHSLGMWTSKGVKIDHLSRYAAKIININKNLNIVKVSYPIENIDLKDGGIPSILSYIAGDAFGSTYVDCLRLIDITLPNELLRYFNGPKFGIEGVRKLIGAESKKPLLGVILKPSLGMNIDRFEKIIEIASKLGVDVIKDDEKMINPSYLTIEKRLKKAMDIINKNSKKTGKQTLYAINISLKPHILLEKAREAVKKGANVIMINAIVEGIGIIQSLVEDQDINVPIYAHRTMHATMTRSNCFGISMVVLAKLLRIAGADFIHCGSISKRHATQEEFIANLGDAIVNNMGMIKKSVPVISAGIHPGNINAHIKFIKDMNPEYVYDVLFMVGTAVYAHPDGVKAGIKALQQAIEVSMSGKDFLKESQNLRELRRAINYFGYIDGY